MAEPALTKKVFTLLVAHERGAGGGGRVLLGMKKRGPGTGKWNGFGGKLEKTDASVKAGAVREFREETGGASPSDDVARVGVLTFHGVGGDPRPWEVHCFSCSGVMGEPVETDEMRPQWFQVNELEALYESMWPDDRHWYPLLLRGARFVFEGWFGGESGEDMLRHTLSEVVRLPPEPEV